MSDDIERYVGSRALHARGDEVPARDGFVYFSPSLDAAIWAAELAEGDAPPHVYRVNVEGPMEDAAERSDYVRPRHPAMSWRSIGPVIVKSEVTEWAHYHGTRASLNVGDLIEPGHAANFGARPRTANFVYFARTVDAATWGAELAAGDGPGRIYVVEPLGEVEDDPNVTNQRLRATRPSRSARGRHFALSVSWRGGPGTRRRPSVRCGRGYCGWRARGSDRTIRSRREKFVAALVAAATFHSRLSPAIANERQDSVFGP